MKKTASKNDNFLLSPSDIAKVKAHAANMLLKWANRSRPHDYDPDYSDDSEVRNLRSAYAHGYNDCRTEILQEIADIVLEGFKQPVSDEDDDECWLNQG